MKKLIFLADIDFKASPKVRAEVHEEAIQDYADAYKAKAPLPPPQLFEIVGSKEFLVGDGRHRLEAWRSLGRKAMECEVRQGSTSDVLKYALSANGIHGIRRTNADKRLCVELATRAWPGLSTKDIATLCAVSEGYVNTVRREDLTDSAPADSASNSGANTSSKEDKKNSSSKNSSKNGGNDESEKEKDDPEPSEPEPPAPPKTPKDDMGFPLTETALEYYERIQEVQDLMTKVSQVRSALKIAQDSEDNLLRHLYSQLLPSLDLSYSLLSSAKPYAVCLICDGTLKETKKRTIMGDTVHDPKGQACQHCHGTGLMSKFSFEQSCKIFPDLKKSRDAAVA